MKSRCARCDMLVWSVKEFAKKLCRDTIEISLFNEYLVKSKNWHGKLPDKWLLNQAINAAGYRVAESSTSEPLEIKGKTPHKIYSRRAKQLKNKFERRRLEYSKHKVEPA